MFCGYCGTNNADNAAFCSVCGAKLEPQQQKKEEKKKETASNNKNRTIGIIAVAVVALVFAVAVFGGRSYKATVKQLVNASFVDADGGDFIKVFPKKVVKLLMEDDDYYDIDEFAEEVTEDLEAHLNRLNSQYGEHKIKYKIVEAEKASKKALSEIKSYYKEEFDVKVSAAKNVEIELTIKYDGGTDTDDLDIYLIKIGRSWYLDIESMGEIL